MRYTTGHIIIALTVVLLAVLIGQGIFIVPEGRQALVFQFGRIVGTPKQEAGLYFKIPFVQNVQVLEKRILNWDGSSETIPTGDKKFIKVDTTGRWQIIDPILFRNSLENFEFAQSKIKNIIDSATRDVISSNNLVEAVRNTNAIIENISAAKETPATLDDFDLSEEEVASQIPPVKIGREQLSQRIVDIVRPQLKNFGIALIDIQIRQIAYEESVEEKVYDRMISERHRIAAKIISYGKGEQAKIRGKISRDLQKIRSEAYRKVQQLKGEAEADAIRLYADAILGEEDFYRFVRTLELYDNSVRPDTRLLLSARSAIFDLMNKGTGQIE